MFGRSLYMLLALSLSGCGQNRSPTAPALPPTADAPFVRVGGRVIDYTTGASRAGVTVHWHTNQPGPVAEVTTDQTGTYSVSLPPTLRYIVTFPMLTQASGGPVIVTTKSHQTDFLINPGHCVLMEGFIFDASTRTAVSGAEVSWVGQRAITRSDGGYRIEPGCGRTYGFGTTAFGVSHPRYMTFFGLGTRAEFLSNGASFRRDELLTPLAAQ